MTAPVERFVTSAGGVVSEMLVHLLDVASWYFGPFAEVEVLQRELLRPTRSIGGRSETVDADDFVLVRLRSTAGVLVLCQADLLTPASISS